MRTSARVLVELTSRQREWLEDVMNCQSCSWRREDSSPCCLLMAEGSRNGPLGHLDTGSLVDECLEAKRAGV